MIKDLFGVVDNAIETKRFIGGLGKLKKDGSVVKINGQIFERRVTKKGDDVILVDNFLGNSRKGQKKKWQLILMNNIICLNSEKWQHNKVA